MTSSRQHHLQYTGGLAETQGLLLPSLYYDALYATPIQTHIQTNYSSFQNFIRDYCSFEQLFLSEHFALFCLSSNFQQKWPNNLSNRCRLLLHKTTSNNSSFSNSNSSNRSNSSNSSNNSNSSNSSNSWSIQYNNQRGRCQSSKPKSFQEQMETWI